ncbi:MAG: DUF1559 domain-containing protein, partial [Planctomycetia bacterium]
LPFLDERELYERYDFAEPWNGSSNAKLASEVPAVFHCPRDKKGLSTPYTNYAAVVGPETIWPRTASVKLKEVKDGSSKTILLVETTGSALHWMEPRDLTFADLPLTINGKDGPGISSVRPGMVHLLFADGSVRSESTKLKPDVLRAMLTRDGGETVEFPEN